MAVRVVAVELSDLVSVEVEHVQTPAVALVRVRGELDFGTTPRLVEGLVGLPGAGEHLVFDLSGLEFCDSSGLGILIATHKAIAAQGRDMFLCGVSLPVMTAITATSLDQLFQIRADVQSVFAELSTG